MVDLSSLPSPFLGDGEGSGSVGDLECGLDCDLEGDFEGGFEGDFEGDLGGDVFVEDNLVLFLVFFGEAVVGI